MDRHRKDVATIAVQVKHFLERGESFRINHGSTNSTRQSVLERSRTIDISHLKHVINVNEELRTILVEPNVPMDRLAETSLKYGLIPPVVMEFPGITAGGGYAGTSGESSSFKHGFFDRTVNFIEMVLANGVPLPKQVAFGPNVRLCSLLLSHLATVQALMLWINSQPVKNHAAYRGVQPKQPYKSKCLPGQIGIDIRYAPR